MSGCPTCGSTQTELNGNDYEDIYHCPACGTVETIPHLREYGKRKTYAPAIVADRDRLLAALKDCTEALSYAVVEAERGGTLSPDARTLIDPVLAAGFAAIAGR